MKTNEMLIDLLSKYIDWAKFNWAWLIKTTNNKMYVKDLEENTTRSISYLIQCILDNGMLDECFTQEELKELYNNVPKRFKEKIKNYIKEI